MGRNAEAAETPDVLDHSSRFAAERIRRCCHIEGDVVAATRADLDTVEAENAVPILRRIRPTSAVAMIGQDDEGESRVCGCGGYSVLVGRTVRARRVNMVG